MKVSDYIVDFLIEKGITCAFGYPGGSVTNLMESFRVRSDSIKAHVVYHEQAAAFAACAYAVTAGVPGVAYATGGPGATNMITAIGHAYYESIPIICFTGNVNVNEMHGDMPIRQKGFQESDIISAVKHLTKFCVCVTDANDIRFCLEKAYACAVEGRQGPVLIDLPMNILREQIEPDKLPGYIKEPLQKSNESAVLIETLDEMLNQSDAPCLILGNGIKTSLLQDLAKSAVENLKIPYVTSMIAFDVIPHNELYNGFIGAYGTRAANLVVSKSDLVISIASRLDIRQVGAIRENFAPGAKIVRIDIDEGELSYKVHEDEISFCMNAKEALEILEKLHVKRDFKRWRTVCQNIQSRLKSIDDRLPNEYIRRISEMVPDGITVTTDVGQNQVWVAQSFHIKSNQQVLFSGGMGAMGHALPAAIGAYYGGKTKYSICICGDGGIQMNIQELQFIARENIPIKIIVFNNYSLGMIRHFQEMYFDNISYQTKENGGYTTPDFAKIAQAYGIESMVVDCIESIDKASAMINNDRPALIEIRINEDTYVFPKLEFGKPNYDQQPLLDRDLLKELMDMK